jgi:hypothetical protein
MFWLALGVLGSVFLAACQAEPLSPPPAIARRGTLMSTPAPPPPPPRLRHLEVVGGLPPGYSWVRETGADSVIYCARSRSEPGVWVAVALSLYTGPLYPSNCPVHLKAPLCGAQRDWYFRQCQPLQFDADAAFPFQLIAGDVPQEVHVSVRAVSPVQRLALIHLLSGARFQPLQEKPPA